MTEVGGPPWVGVDWEDAVDDKPETKAAISLGIAEADRWLRARASTEILNTQHIIKLHRIVFIDVFPDFAGKIRGPSPNYIAYNVTFGSRRGVPHEDVPDAMEALGSATVNLIRQLDDLRAEMPADDFLVEVTKAAAYTHCRFVEIHPFVNGNGRTARLCVNYFLRRYNLPLIAIERSDEAEYIDAIRSWIDQRSVDHFARFLRDQIEFGAT